MSTRDFENYFYPVQPDQLAVEPPDLLLSSEGLRAYPGKPDPKARTEIHQSSIRLDYLKKTQRTVRGLDRII